MTRIRRTPGFTLVEVMAALLLAGMVALLVSRIVSVVTSAARSLTTERTRLDREQNGRRWLQVAFRSLEAGDSLGGFEGLPDRVSFTSWLAQSGGWFEPTRLVLSADSGRLVARLPGSRVVLRDSVSNLELDYLLEPGARTHWVRQWISPLSAPLLVRLRLTRSIARPLLPPYRPTALPPAVDTLLFLIGSRG